MRKCKPIVCTLNAAELGGRAVRWRTVMREGVESMRRCKGGYVLTLKPDAHVLTELDHLVRAERACCAWMNLDLQHGDQPTLRMTADSRLGSEVIRALLGL